VKVKVKKYSNIKKKSTILKRRSKPSRKNSRFSVWKSSEPGISAYRALIIFYF
jgi:hypothetical protein